MALGDNIKELRESMGISQKELGQSVGVSDVMISMYEQGKKRPSLENAEKMAAFFGVSTDRLLYGKNDEIGRVYLSFAKEAEKNGIHPDDIMIAIESIKRVRGRK